MITELQLLSLLRHSIYRASATEHEVERQQLLGNASLLVNELLLRNSRGFFVDFYNEGAALAQEGMALAFDLDIDLGDTGAELSSLPGAMPSNSTADDSHRLIYDLWAALNALVALLPPGSSGAAGDYLDRLNQWEVEIYAHRETMAPEPDLDTVTEAVFTADAFAEYLKQKFPEWKGLEIHDFFQIGGGFSKQTLLMDVEDEVNGKQGLAVRAQPSRNILALPLTEIDDEYHAVRIAFDEGVTVAEPLWLETDTSFFGTKFLVSRRIFGRNLGDARGATEEVTDAMVASLAAEAAKVNAINLSAHIDSLSQTPLAEWCRLKTVEEATRFNIQFWRELTVKESLAKSPLLERGFRWLEENVEPCQGTPSLIHGDIGLHNVLIDNGAVTAVLDWEVAHIGDPAEELAWLLACTNAYATRQRLLEAYYQAGGKPISEFRLRYYEVLMCLRMPIAALGMAKKLEVQLDSPQLAIFALRFMHANSSRLVDAIKAAEAVRT
ncbi:MAG: phosphotransferase family protein [Halieaceae bacterium]|nr:phosphotransferase family protein [Halieaceae bacterium]